MNALDRAIAWISPNAGVARARARHALRIYEGAAVGRRAASFKALNTSANAELQGALRPLRDRSRDLARNTPYAARMLDVLTAHAVGTGIRPVPDTGSDRYDRRLEDLWGEWERRADVTGQMSFYEMQALAFRSMIESGESVLRFIDQPLDDTRRVPFALQILEADFIDQWRDGIYGDPAAKSVAGLERSRLGVGLGEFDRRLGLWLNPYHPGEITTANMRPGVSTFVEQDELIHLFKVLRPGQVRGVPWFAPILMTARDLADFVDAVNVKARVEACFAGFITNDPSTAPIFDPAQPSAGFPGRANPGAMVTSLEPGMLKQLEAGQHVEFAQPTSSSQVEPILMFNLQAMAAGIGCTYDQATGDLRGANFSSMRAGKIEFWRLNEQNQEHILKKLCHRTWDRFISRCILAGFMPERRDPYRVNWVTPAREAINPVEDMKADMMAVRTGRMSPQEYVAAWGGDWRKNQDLFAAFFERGDGLGLVFDIDPRRTDQTGNQTDPATQPTLGDPTSPPPAPPAS